MRKRTAILLTALAAALLAVTALACESSSSGAYSAWTPTPWMGLDGMSQTHVAADLQLGHAEATAEAARATATSAARALDEQARRTDEARQEWYFHLEQTQVARTMIAEEAMATATTEVQLTETAIARAEQTKAAVVQETAQAQAATATATREMATATAQALIDALIETQVGATAQAVDRANQQEQATQTLRTYGPWALLVLGLAVLGLVGWQVLPVLIDRWSVIRRKSDEGEPIVVLREKGEDGVERSIALPLRSAQHMFSTREVPELPSPEMQDRATARQQLANVVHAARSGGNKKKRRMRPALAAAGQPAPQVAPGTIQVVEPERVQGWLEDVEGQLVEEVA